MQIAYMIVDNRSAAFSGSNWNSSTPDRRGRTLILAEGASRVMIAAPGG